MKEFEKELRSLVNKYNVDDLMCMPDYLLAKMVCNILEAIGPSVKETVDNSGRMPYIL